MKQNRMKQVLRQGKPVIGFVLGSSDPLVAEVVGRAGFDFIIVDTQHTTLSIGTAQDMLIGLHPTESTIVARAAWNDPVRIGQLLDLGAEGIIVPFVNTEAQARDAVAACKYPLEGTRSFGPRRAMSIYADGATDYSAHANDNILVLPQIETKEALDNLDAILSVKGVDGVMIGPADLSLSLGFIPGSNVPKVDEAIRYVLDKCKEHNVPWGMFTSTMDLARKWLKQGGLIATGGSDLLFINQGVQRLLQEIRDLKSELG